VILDEEEDGTGFAFTLQFVKFDNWQL